jgi:hypothetical protein
LLAGVAQSRLGGFDGGLGGAQGLLGLVVGGAGVDTAQAALASAEALLTQAKVGFERQQSLMRSGYTVWPDWTTWPASALRAVIMPATPVFSSV